MKTFEELGVREDLLKAIDEMGFVMPMPIQELVIPHLLTSDNDVVALAQTGTGKTAAYGLPVIQRTDTKINRPQVLILAPTRELCLQIGSDLADFSKYVENLSILPVYGGSSIESQIRSLKKGVQIIVATPGRLIDLINRNTVSLDGVHTVILDEADEMLNMGFVESIEEILANVPYDRKMLMFSATMPTEIAKIAKKYMHNPEEYVVGTRNEGAENVRHVYFMVHARDKYKALKRVADYNPNIYGIIFCRTRRETQEVADWLIQDGYNADSLHGDLSQAQRDMVMKKFRERNLQLLVATDVAARGLDVTDLTHVINYGLPDDIATYTHRSGRTGRAGKTGVSVSIVHSKEKGKIRDIEKRIGKKFEYMEVPKPVQIIEKQLYNLADRIEKVDVDDEEIGKYLPGVLKKLSWLDGEDLLKRVLSLEFNRLLEYYKGAPVLDVVTERGKKAEKKDRPARTAEEKDRRVAEKGYERVYINLGKADGFYAQNLIELINKNVDGQRVDIGRIDLLSGYSLFDVRQGDAQRVVGSVKNSDFYGKRVYCEIAKADKDYAAENVGKGGKRRSRGEELRKRVSSDDFATNRRSRRERRGGKDGKAEKPEKKMHGNYDKFIKKDK
ncbi:MAG: DEAD/DEAH box helicase [Muribaculaceae bacterium]|nr:DEAD/DEAH box helicase [Muribaculaceae bacterium]